MKLQSAVLWTVGAIVAVLLILAGLHQVGFRFDPFNSAGKAKAALGTATQGQAVAKAQIPIVEHYGTTTRVIIQQAEKGAADVQKLPGADDRLDPAFAAGLSGLLDPPAAVPGPVDPGQP